MITELIDFCTVHEDEFVTYCSTSYPGECQYVKAVVVRTDEVDVEALSRAWKYGIHLPEVAERGEAWDIVIEQVGKLLEILESTLGADNG